MQAIEMALPEVDSVPYRINQLRGQKYRKAGTSYFATPNSSYLREEYSSTTEDHLEFPVPQGTYILTDLGRTALQDHELAQKSHRRELWLKNAWIPILVTVATNLAIRALGWLTPLIQGWLSNTP